ncbi:dihydroorotate dehydrogenase electron transfer subunit [Alloiococcus sp. CFN-8]|uniref:dihydroorotate dehydrogenase electron transfer subunit n=1 Tax=Alloiococcus sp. CFN-8 TaxID=3416081 RepID=UPI003CF30AEB
MGKASYQSCRVIENKEIAEGVFKICVKGSFNAAPGQFFMVRAWEEEPLLSRPISLHRVIGDEYYFLYQLVGRGTELIRKLSPGEELRVMGPLGNGFPVEELQGKIAIVAGGIGIAPFEEVVYKLKENKKVTSIEVYAGFRKEVYGLSNIEKNVQKLTITTEDGSSGRRGYVTDGLDLASYDTVLCCGPEVMMNKVVNLCRELKVRSLISTEKRMACGLGACFGCTCKTNMGNKRSCVDGPVFKGEDLILDSRS